MNKNFVSKFQIISDEGNRRVPATAGVLDIINSFGPTIAATQESRRDFSRINTQSDDEQGRERAAEQQDVTSELQQREDQPRIRVEEPRLRQDDTILATSGDVDDDGRSLVNIQVPGMTFFFTQFSRPRSREIGDYAFC